VLTTNACVSLLAVPFPITIRLRLWDLIIFKTVFSAPSKSFCGGTGNMVLYSKNFPDSSSATALHPVLKPGSIAKTRLFLRGGVISNSLRFFANNSIAASPAFSLMLCLISRLIEGSNMFLKPYSSPVLI